jgi:hypothetical protein
VGLGGSTVSAGSFGAATGNTTVGCLAGSFIVPSPHIVVIGLLATDAQALSDADLATTEAELLDNLAQGRDLDSGLSVLAPTTYWDARDVDYISNTWAARGAGTVLTRVGNVQRFGRAGRST